MKTLLDILDVYLEECEKAGVHPRDFKLADAEELRLGIVYEMQYLSETQRDQIRHIKRLAWDTWDKDSTSIMMEVYCVHWNWVLQYYKHNTHKYGDEP